MITVNAMIKILAIGNSFSTDATAYVEPISESIGKEIFVRNLFVGGCSLKMHAGYLLSKEMVYEYQRNGEYLRLISLPEALEAEAWDHITLQQASHDSGLIETYEPYLSILITAIKKACPKATLHWHQTWAYEHDSDHPNFDNYERSQNKMFSAISDNSRIVCTRYGLSLIPVGSLIQHIRGLPPFNTRDGGVSLCRDGFHLSFTYGRFIAALCWSYHFLGDIVSSSTFEPLSPDRDLMLLIASETRNHLSSL